MLLWYPLSVRDSPQGGVRMTGLTPTWVALDRLDTGEPIAERPKILELGNGRYRYGYDPEVFGDASGQIDFGPTLTQHSDRYQDVLMVRENSRALEGTPAITGG